MDSITSDVKLVEDSITRTVGQAKLTTIVPPVNLPISPRNHKMLPTSRRAKRSLMSRHGLEPLSS